MLASRLFGAIADDVVADVITRKQALERVSQAIEEVCNIDRGVLEREPMLAISQVVNDAFSIAKYNKTTPAEIGRIYGDWMKRGDGQISEHYTPFAVERAYQSSMEFFSSLSRLSDFRIEYSDFAPWEIGFEFEEGAEIIVYRYRDDLGGAHKFGCRFIAENDSLDIEDVLTFAHPGRKLNEFLIRYQGEALEQFEKAIVVVGSKMLLANESLLLVKEPENLVFFYQVADGNYTLAAAWKDIMLPVTSKEAPPSCENKKNSMLDGIQFEGDNPMKPI